MTKIERARESREKGKWEWTEEKWQFKIGEKEEYMEWNWVGVGKEGKEGWIGCMEESKEG